MREKAAVTCICYCRTSTKGQKDRLTIKAQRTTVERLRNELGAELLPYGPRGDGRLEDDGRSARLLEGREFAKLIDDLEHGRVKPKPPDYLIVPETSRLSREDTFSDDPKVQIQSGIDNARINSVLRVRGVKVVDTKGVHLDLRQEALENSHERDKIRTRTMRGKAQKLAEGKRASGGYAPYGYVLVREDLNDRRSEIVQKRHPENAKRLARLIVWFIKGGYEHAAREATRAGFELPKSKKIGPWNAVTVRHIILKVRDGVYSGKQTFTFDGKAHTLKCEPLPEIHAMQAAVIRACDEITLPTRAKFLSTGFVDCQCGAHVHEKNSHGRHHTRCAHKCGSIPEKLFNETLWRATVARLLQIHEHEGGKGGAKNFETRLREAQAKVKDAEAAIGRLFDAKESGYLPVPEWKARVDPWKIKLMRAEADVREIEGEREKEERAQTNQQTLEARIKARLAELKAVELSGPDVLKRKREWLGDLLGGGRVTVTWRRTQAGRWAEITFPAYRDLLPIVVRTDDPPFSLTGEVKTVEGEMYLRVEQPWNEKYPDLMNLARAQDAHLPRSKTRVRISDEIG